MTEYNTVAVNGVQYRPVDEEKAAELAERLRTFKAEGADFWKQRFEFDSAPDAWNAGMYEVGDENRRFFSEAFLYNLLGKDDARSVLHIVRELAELAGVDFR